MDFTSTNNFIPKPRCGLGGVMLNILKIMMKTGA